MCLKRPLIAICSEEHRLKVNLHFTIPLLIRESDLMAKMDLPLPTVALTLFTKQDHFTLVNDSLQVNQNCLHQSRPYNFVLSFL